MRIEVFEGAGGWYWHFLASNGMVTAQGESHPVKSKAIRAAKGVVRAVCKPMGNPGYHSCQPTFTQTEKNGVTIISWS